MLFLLPRCAARGAAERAGMLSERLRAMLLVWRASLPDEEAGAGLGGRSTLAPHRGHGRMVLRAAKPNMPCTVCPRILPCSELGYVQHLEAHVSLWEHPPLLHSPA